MDKDTRLLMRAIADREVVHNEIDRHLEMLQAIIDRGEIHNEMDCLKTISISVTDYCNLKCPMCPNSLDDYIHKEHRDMSIETMDKVCERLQELPTLVLPRITISGNGEPMLNKNIIVLLHNLWDMGIRPTLITNGTIEPADKELIEKHTNIIVSIHDMNREKELRELWPTATFRNNDPGSPSCELHTTNRGGIMGKPEQRNLNPCTCLFYKMSIDVDGNYLKCAEVFNKVPPAFAKSVYNMSIEEYFTKQIEHLKILMATKGRQGICGCTDCDIDGTLVGMKYLEWYKNEYCKRTSR